MKHNVRRKGTDQAFALLGKGGINHTETQEFKNRKDRHIQNEQVYDINDQFDWDLDSEAEEESIP